MAKQIFDETTTTAVNHVGSNENWEFTKASSVDVASGNALTVSGSSNRYSLLGSLKAGQGDAIYMVGIGNDIVVGKSAHVVGDNSMFLQGGDISTINHGVIRGGIVGDISDSGMHWLFSNDGTVSSWMHVQGDSGVRRMHVKIANAEGGLISSDSGSAIEVDNARTKLVNEGTIEATTAFYSSNGPAIIKNHGDIAGNIYLGGGQNYVDTRGGTIDGDITITGDFSRNTLVTDNADYHFVGGDNNIIKSTVSYKLHANDRQLRLLGHGDVNGTGSVEGANLYGNTGDNILHARNGANVLTGQSGNDTLIGIKLDAPLPSGGEQYVDFVFGRNDDQDTIVNFTGVKGIKDGVQFRDEIRLEHLFEVSDFADLYKLMSQHGSDAWIDFGHGDLLIFKDFNYHAFRPEDFTFDVN